MTVPIPLLVVLAFAVVFLVGFLQPMRAPEEVLKARYVALSRLSRAQAEAELQERLASLAQRFPGRSLAWYLEWLVTDLARAKR